MSKQKKSFSEIMKDVIISVLLLGILGVGFTEAVIAKGNATKANYISATRSSTQSASVTGRDVKDVAPVMVIGLGFAALAFYTYRKNNEI